MRCVGRGSAGERVREVAWVYGCEAVSALRGKAAVRVSESVRCGAYRSDPWKKGMAQLNIDLL